MRDGKAILAPAKLICAKGLQDSKDVAFWVGPQVPSTDHLGPIVSAAGGLGWGEFLPRQGRFSTLAKSRLHSALFVLLALGQPPLSGAGNAATLFHVLNRGIEIYLFSSTILNRAFSVAVAASIRLPGAEVVGVGLVIDDGILHAQRSDDRQHVGQAATLCAIQQPSVQNMQHTGQAIPAQESQSHA
jgi:hypothetical protein